MDILIVGGFLGSGKTSLIRLLIQGLINSRKTCAVIENEIGEIGIDDKLIERAGLKVTPLFGGCVCCQISGDLMLAVERIEDEISPDWVIVEMTGLALMDGIKKVFAQYGRQGLNIHTLSVVDISRWNHLTGPLCAIFDRQIAGADVIFINKTDIRTPTAENIEVLTEKSPHACISQLDSGFKESDALWSELLRCIDEHGRTAQNEH